MEDAVVIEKMKVEVITNSKYNKNIDIEYQSAKFAHVSNSMFDVQIDGVTRKGPGEVIAEFTAAIRYEIMTKDLAVNLMKYQGKDDES